MAFANPATEVESLFVRIFADASGYFKTVRMVRDQNISLRSTFLSLMGVASSASQDLAKVAAAVTGLSVAFGKLDDSLTRTLGHMRDWASTARPILEHAVAKVSGSSRTGPFEVARGLDVLVTSGMNAAMAARALGVAETFAVAADMGMVEATRHLVDIQRSLGLSSQDVETHFTNMNHLADTFVGLAPLVGSSTQEFTEGFGPRMVSMMRMLDMSFDEGAKLIAIYSLNSIRGSEASDRAAQALQALSRYSLENMFRWRALGVEVFDTRGKMLPLADIIGGLTRQLGMLAPAQRVATLALLGFERRTIAAVLPLIGMEDAARALGEEMARLGGINKLMAEMMRRDFIGQLKMAWNNTILLAVAIGQHLAPIVAFFGEHLRSLTQWFRDLHPGVRSFVIISSMIFFALNPAVKLINSLIGFLNPIRLLAGFFYGVYRAVALLISPLTLVVGLLYRVFAGGFVLILGVLREVWSVLKSVSMGIVSIFGSVVGIFANLIFWTFALATILTLITGIGTLMVAIGGTISALFGGFMALVGRFAQTLEESWEDIKDAGVRTFLGVSSAAKNFFKSLGEFIVDIAGFFWNFQENMHAILQFVSKNWRALLTDIENLTRVVFTNLGHNLLHVWDFLVVAFKEAFGLIWGHIRYYVQTILQYVIFNWDKIAYNLSEVFSTFFNNLLHNWGIVVEAMAEILMSKLFGNRFAGLRGVWSTIAGTMGFMSREELARFNESIMRDQRDQPAILADAWRRMRTPLEGMGLLREMTSMRSTTAIGISTRAIQLPPAMAGVLSSIGGAFSHLTSVLTPLTEGFSSVLQERLGLNLSLPPDAMNQLIEGWRRFMRPFTGEGMEPGMQFSGGGPGLTFKQVSLSRFMTGGPDLQRLDYEQLVALRQISNHTAILAQVANAWLTGQGRPGGRPRVVAGFPMPFGPDMPVPVLGQ